MSVVRQIVCVFMIAGITAGIAACANTTAQLAVPVTPDAGLAARQIVLGVHQDRTSAVSMAGGSGRPYLRRQGYRATPKTDRTLNRIAREYEMERVDGWAIRPLDMYCEIYQVEDHATAERLIAELSSDPRVELVQPMNLFETLASRYDDPYVDLQSAIEIMEVEEAHQWATGRGVTVAVIDSVIDVDHADLGARIKTRKYFIVGKPNSIDADIHGTAVAGVIAAVANNQVGIVGVAPEVNIVALGACWPKTDGSGALCSSLTLAKALEYALTSKPDIINLSIGGPADPLLSQLLERAVSAGTLVVAAHPGGIAESAGFPTMQQGVIVARSQDPDGQIEADHSGWDSVTAPGRHILTTVPDDSYAYLSGSSLATAHVSGVIALLLEHHPDLSSVEVMRVLTTSSDSIDAGSMINACRSLAGLSDSTGCENRLASD